MPDATTTKLMLIFLSSLSLRSQSLSETPLGDYYLRINFPNTVRRTRQACMPGRFAMATGLFVLTIAMSVGIFVATMGMGQPRLWHTESTALSEDF